MYQVAPSDVTIICLSKLILLPLQNRASENERSSLIGRESEARKEAEVRLREKEVESDQKANQMQTKLDQLDNKVIGRQPTLQLFKEKSKASSSYRYGS